MPRAMKEGDDPHLVAPEAERSDFWEERQRESLPNVPVEKVGKETLPWGVRLKAAKTTASTPRCLGLAGIIILAISAGIIVTGIALPNRPQSSSPASSTNAPSVVDRDGDGVPLDALQPPDPGSLSECTVKLENWESYAANAAQAEIKAYGVEIAKATPDAIISSLQSLPQLLLKIKFLVLYSPSHPWSRSFQDSAALQTSLLNAAFSGMKLGFQLEGVVGIPATDKQVQDCGNPEEENDVSSSIQEDGDDKGIIRSGSFVSQVLLSVDTSSLINVIVCDPAGINGATSILGGKIDITNKSSDESIGSTDDDDHHAEDDPSLVHSQDVLDRSIVLRRGALWQSRTSLVHQLGHYLGLPHPFPDTKTCKYDADTIVDTPPQYQSSTSCDTNQPIPLCDENYELSLEVERYPMYGFMETSTGNGIAGSSIDSHSDGTRIGDAIGGDCRKHFSPGQVLRARAMLRMLRPELHKAASAASKSENKKVMKRVPWSGYGESSSSGVVAFQSGLPSAAVVARQLALWKVSATTTAAVTASTLALDPQRQQHQNNISMLFPNNEEAASRITSALDQARQAAGEGGSTSLEECTCLGPDEAGNSFWTGKLDAVYSVDAVRIVQPWESVANTTFLNNILRSIQIQTSTSTSTPSSSSSSERQVSPSPPSPSSESELLPSSRSVLPRSPSPTGPASQNLSVAVPTVEVRVGESPNFYKNKVCGTVELAGDKLVQHIACRGSSSASLLEDVGGESGGGSGSLSGQFITVRWTNSQKIRPLHMPILFGMSSIPPAAAAVAAAAAAAAMPPPCLCDVAALSYSSLPIRPAVAAAGQVPGALLNTPSSSSSAAAAVAGEGKQPRFSSLTSCSMMTFNSSSSSAAGGGGGGGKEAYLSMPLTDTTSITTDPVLINGVRFSVPNRCTGLTIAKPKTTAAHSFSSSSQDIVPLLWQPPAWNTTSLKCGYSSAAAAGAGGLSNSKNVTLDIYVFPAGSDDEKIHDRKKDYLCAARVEVPPGQVVDIECDQTLEGHVITFFLLSSPSGSSPLADLFSRNSTTIDDDGDTVPLLELCGVQPIGGITLINSDIIAAEQQTTVPESLMPLFSLAVDGRVETCLVDTRTVTIPTSSAGSAGNVGDSGNNAGNNAAPGTSFPADEEQVLVSPTISPTTPTALWKTGFIGNYLIFGVEITTKLDGIAPENTSGGGARGDTGAIEDTGGIQLTLFDAAGNEIVVKQLLSFFPSPRSTTTSGEGDATQVISVAITPPVYAKSVQITGFTSLCEVSFTAASRTPIEN